MVPITDAAHVHREMMWRFARYAHFCDVGESGRLSSERETMFMLGGGELVPCYGWDRLEMARLAGLPVVVAGVGLSLLGRLPAQAGMAKRALEINSEYNDFLFLPVQK